MTNINSPSLTKKTLVFLYSFSLLIGFASIFSLPKGTSLSSGLFLFSSIFGLFYCIYYRQEKNLGINKYLLLIVLLYSLSILSNKLIHGDKIELARIGLLLFVFFLLIPYDRKILNFSIAGIALAGIIQGVLTLYFISDNHLMRVGGFINPLHWAQGALILIIFNIYFISFTKSFLVKATLLLAASGSLIALFFSQGRGIWLSLVILILLFLLQNIKTIYKNKKQIILGLLIVSISLTTISFNKTTKQVVSNRYIAMKHDFNKLKNKQYNTSIGLRYLMWQSAWISFTEHPILGVGKDNFITVQKKQIKENKIDKTLIENPATSTHAHNQFLHTLSLRGLMGFIPLILLIFSPFYLKTLYNPTAIYISVGYITSSLTNAILEPKEAFMFLILSLMLSAYIKQLGKMNDGT